MAIFELTASADTVGGGGEDDTVYAVPGTLNAVDSLTGGGGINTLVLSEVNGGTFRIDELATFAGFENIRLDSNGGLEPIVLYLGSQSVAVTSTYAGGGSEVHLGSGAVTFQGAGSNDVYCSSASN